MNGRQCRVPLHVVDLLDVCSTYFCVGGEHFNATLKLTPTPTKNVFDEFNA